VIGISKLYCGTVEPSDPLRYGRRSSALPSRLLQFSADKKPVVVWNATQRCNLACAHCYSASTSRPGRDELTTDEARALIDDLAAFGVPAMLFSGGEPLLREDLADLIAHAATRGLRAVLSTNGTLISPSVAKGIAQAGAAYVGVSLDGLEAVNDAFRGRRGAFRQALAGVRNCIAAGVKVGLRMTMARANVADLPGMLELVRREGIARVCFYHLAYSGRGWRLREDALTHEQTRAAVGLIMDGAAALHAEGRHAEVLTVDNHADGPLVVMRLEREDPARAEAALELLRMNGGNSSGVGIGCVSWNGDVHPDQFWRRRVVGNIRRRPFSQIWSDPRQPLLAMLRDRGGHLKGRCATCRWLDVCNGNLRCRAEAAGDAWGDDPACYLTDEEVAPQGP
jgi:12,18-didecarboxysiroheme deacetylase